MTALPRGCFVAEARQRVSFEAARRAAVALARPLGRTEEVPLAAAHGRILARPVVAPGSLPPFDQAAMDGYAVRLAGLNGVPLVLPVVGQTNAGDAPAALAPGTAHRVMTGAALPAGADAVVMQEEATRHGDRVQIGPDIAPNAHVRRAGEDVRKGTTVLAAGRVLGWPEIALLGALGIAGVTVAAPLRVAVLTAGSELRRPGEALSPGAIHDANGPMLAALLAGPGVAVSPHTVGDDLDATAGFLARLAASCDLVVTTAGMAGGEKDQVRPALAAAGGELSVVTVAMKPGKPLALGRLGKACFVGLPGNPQAAAFAALAFVRPMIAGLLGETVPPRLTARLAFSCRTRPERTELLPIRLVLDEGCLLARRAGPDGSHRMMPMAGADAVAVLPGSAEPLAAGVPVEVLPFERLRFAR